MELKDARRERSATATAATTTTTAACRCSKHECAFVPQQATRRFPIAQRILVFEAYQRADLMWPSRVKV